jgi:hypothetical protein
VALVIGLVTAVAIAVVMVIARHWGRRPDTVPFDEPA